MRGVTNKQLEPLDINIRRIVYARGNEKVASLITQGRVYFKKNIPRLNNPQNEEEKKDG